MPVRDGVCMETSDNSVGTLAWCKCTDKLLLQLPLGLEASQALDIPLRDSPFGHLGSSPKQNVLCHTLFMFRESWQKDDFVSRESIDS